MKITRLLIALSSLIISSCVVHDINYVKAANMQDAGDDAGAFKNYYSVAQSDSYPEAQFAVGDAYLEGKGATQNTDKAIYWFKRVLASKSKTWKSLAHARLKDIYSGQYEFSYYDPANAMKHARECAALGADYCKDEIKRLINHPAVYISENPNVFSLPSSREAPGSMDYANEIYLGGKHSEAKRIFDWHARKGNSSAQLRLAVLYENEGKTLLSNAWAYKAALAGEYKAQAHMGDLIYNLKISIAPLSSDKRAIYWLEKASLQNYALATNYIGIIYANPISESTPNHELAYKYFEKAAALGNTDAISNIGDTYAYGLGKPKDKTKAITFYTRAADQGNVYAKNKLFTEYGIAYGQSEQESSTPDTKDTTKVTSPKVVKSQPIPEAIEPTKPVELGLVELFELRSPSVHKVVPVKLKGSSDLDPLGQGSAVSISNHLAITNYHVMEDSDGLISKNIHSDKSPQIWFTIVTDKKRDLAIISTKDSLKSFVSDIRPTKDLKVGEKVFAIGSPRGNDNTLSEGIVSGIRNHDGVRFIQTTAPFAPGSSGGGLFDSSGKLIGITTKIHTGEGNLNFAVAIEELDTLMDRIKRK